MPNLKVREYLNLKNDPEFRDKIAMLCETCILKIMQNIEKSD